MKINIVAVGKIKEKFFVDAINEYKKRMSRYATFNIIEVSDAPQGKSPSEQQKIEGERLLSKAGGYIIVLDSGGKNLSSEQIASTIKTKCSNGVSEFSFLIGGSHGHGKDVIDKADLRLSFGANTFPHQLFRVMLAEQIYRAMTINSGLPYHK